MTNLKIWLPEAAARQVPAVRNLANVAPVFEYVRSQEGPGYVAEFSDLADQLHVVVLMEDALQIPGVRLTVDDRPVARPAQFWSTVLCYWESLGASDKAAYCLRRSAKVGDAAGCPNHACLSHCQFICARCLGVVDERGAPPVGSQLLAIARQAEVDWCPNLALPSI
jgi:hypothetical protein